MDKNAGGRPEKTGSNRLPVSNRPPTIADIGVTKTQSSRWQKLASLDDEVFERRVADHIGGAALAFRGFGHNVPHKQEAPA
jgi:hypothetical protein